MTQLRPEDEEAVLDALRRGYWGGIGDAEHPSSIFEREFARYHGADHGLVVGNGTLSLELALRAGGVRPGDEVLVPAITFVATASAVVSIGAVPIFVDVDPETCQISPSGVEEGISSETGAVVAVHYGSGIADLDSLTEVASKHDLLLIEDCAHMHGAAWRNRGVGSWGDFGAFSFQQSKTLAAGEGGLLLTSDEELFERASLMRNIGRIPEKTPYGHYLCAPDIRLGGLQGALLLSRFRRFPEEAVARDANLALFGTEVEKVPGLRMSQRDARVTQRGCYFALLDFDDGAFGCSRDRFVAALRAEGVYETGTGYGHPLYREPAFEPERLRPLLHGSLQVPDYPGMCLPGAERWAARQVTIAHPFLLGDESGVRMVLDAISKVKGNVPELAG